MQKELDLVGRPKDKKKVSKVFLGRSLEIQTNYLLFYLTHVQEKYGFVYFFSVRKLCEKN